MGNKLDRFTEQERNDLVMMLSLTLAACYHKNLLRSVNVLVASAQELELEDTQSRLQQDLRHRLATEGKFYCATAAA